MQKSSYRRCQNSLNHTGLTTLPGIKLILNSHTSFSKKCIISKDVLANIRVLKIWINYPSNFFKTNLFGLQIHPNVFESTKTYTTYFILNMIDCTMLDLNFLSGFEKLTDLTFNHVLNIQNCFYTKLSFSSSPNQIKYSILHWNE